MSDALDTLADLGWNFGSALTEPSTVHDIREWAITSYFPEYLLDACFREYHKRGRNGTAYQYVIEYMCASARTAPDWQRRNANRTCWWETTDTTLKLWPNPRAYGDPPVVVFQLDELARLAFARRHGVSCETANGQIEMGL